MRSFKIKKCAIADLNRETREYLHHVWRKRGADHPGVFNRTGRAWRGVAGCVAGIALLALAWAGLRPDSLYNSLPAQCTFTAVGVVGLVSSIQSLRRRWGRGSLSDFTYFDGSWFWDVRPTRTGVTDLRRAVGLQLINHYSNGAQTKTVAHVALAEDEKVAFTFARQEAAQEFAAFLQICLHIRAQALRGQLASDVRQFVSDAGGLAQAARAFLNSEGKRMTLERKTVVPIPDPADLPESRFGLVRLARTAVLGLGLFVAGWFSFPPLRYAIDHQHHYKMATRVGDEDTKWPSAYLEKFPDGSHREEITAILDDRRFLTASRAANLARSPAAIRNYLSNEPNVLHRDEARAIIATYYDEAGGRILKLASGPQTDKNLLAGLLSILDHLKSQLTSRVTVVFRPTWTAEPADVLMQQSEKKAQSFYATKDEVIAQMLRTRGSAIIGTYETFSETQVRRREAIILNRLRESVAKILSSDIIEFQRGSSEQRGEIIIEYDTHPRGLLTRYVRVPDETPGTPTALRFIMPQTTNTLGLLREYAVDWRVTIHPGSAAPPFTFQLTSHAGTNLVYRSSPGDPDWAVYAVLMYSIFHDFSNRMLSGAGLVPPPAPTKFTFQDAISR